MVTHHRLIRRAQLRSLVLHEPYLLSREAVRALSIRQPVVPAADHWQRRLEGLVFRRLGYFHVAGTNSDAMRIQRVMPSRDSLHLWFTGMPVRYLESLAGILPVWAPDGGEGLIAGHSGVRYRKSSDDRSVELYVLGRPASVTLHGLDVAAFEEIARTPSEPDLLCALTEQFLSPAEQLSAGDDEHEADTDAAVSAIIRRAGLFRRAAFDSVDLWPTRPDRLSVEIITADRSRRTFERLLAALTSPHLEPRLLLTHTEGHAGYRSMLRIQGHACEVDLRIQTF